MTRLSKKYDPMMIDKKKCSNYTVAMKSKSVSILILCALILAIVSPLTPNGPPDCDEDKCEACVSMGSSLSVNISTALHGSQSKYLQLILSGFYNVPDMTFKPRLILSQIKHPPRV